MGDVVLGNVVEGVFESPVSDGVAFSESSTDWCVLELMVCNWVRKWC